MTVLGKQAPSLLDTVENSFQLIENCRKQRRIAAAAGSKTRCAQLGNLCLSTAHRRLKGMGFLSRCVGSIRRELLGCAVGSVANLQFTRI